MRTEGGTGGPPAPSSWLARGGTDAKQSGPSLVYLMNGGEQRGAVETRLGNWMDHGQLTSSMVAAWPT